jgi:hypothetical protein
MSRMKYLDLPEGYVAIEDIENRGTLYALTPEINQKVREIVHPYLNRVDHVPNEENIPVLPISFAETINGYQDIYRISSDTPVFFPVYRIYWPWIQFVKRPDVL